MKEASSCKEQIEVTCPICREKGMFSGVSFCNGSRDRAMRKRILYDENLFFYTCPQCAETIRVDMTGLYCDDDHRFMVCLHPSEQLQTQYEALVAAKEIRKNYRCRSARTWGEWREKIVEMETSRDDRWYEVLKAGAHRLLKPELRRQYPLAMCHIDYGAEGERTEQRNLVFLDATKAGEGVSYVISERILQQTKDIFSPILQQIQTVKPFSFIDAEWADALLTEVLRAAAKQPHGYAELLGYWIQCVGAEIFHYHVRGEAGPAEKL